MKRIAPDRIAYLYVICMVFTILSAALNFRTIEAQEPQYFVIPEVHGFQDLHSYGEWVQDTRHGKVWRPFVVQGWRPFYFGHWLWTDYGWTWISYEPFGWIVFHYGQWTYTRDLGWFWIPGQEWSPAPVIWFRYSAYVGWAARSPAEIVLPQPWVSTEVVFWNVVKIENFLREKVGDFVKPTLPDRPPKISQMMMRPPGMQEVQHIANQLIEVSPITTQEVSGQPQPLKRMSLPDKEIERVERHQSVVVKRVLKPKIPESKPIFQ